MPDDPATLLKAIGAEVFEALATRPSVKAIWWPRFERLIPWIIAAEQRRRTPGFALLAEIKGKTTLDGFTLSAKADRLEKHAGGKLAILDYKTGAPPSATAVRDGSSPQLPLEAVIAREGGFPGVGPGEAEDIELLYWELKGRQEPGKESAVDPKDRDLVEEARAGLLALIETYRDPAMPYLAQPRGGLAPRFNDYEYLERLAEWSAGGDGGEE